jgi:hypothetical protein
MLRGHVQPVLIGCEPSILKVWARPPLELIEHAAFIGGPEPSAA